MKRVNDCQYGPAGGLTKALVQIDANFEEVMTEIDKLRGNIRKLAGPGDSLPMSALTARLKAFEKAITIKQSGYKIGPHVDWLENEGIKMDSRISDIEKRLGGIEAVVPLTESMTVVDAQKKEEIGRGIIERIRAEECRRIANIVSNHINGYPGTICDKLHKAILAAILADTDHSVDADKKVEGPLVITTIEELHRLAPELEAQLREDERSKAQSEINRWANKCCDYAEARPDHVRIYTKADLDKAVEEAVGRTILMEAAKSIRYKNEAVAAALKKDRERVEKWIYTLICKLNGDEVPD